jgi:hypothetical protein
VTTEAATAQSFCWSYDSFGNRTGSTSGSACAGTISPTVNYNPNNQVTWVQNTMPTGPIYDAAGDVTTDTQNVEFIEQFLRAFVMDDHCYVNAKPASHVVSV